MGIKGSISNEEFNLASELITERSRERGDWRGDKLALVRRLIYEADSGDTEEWKWRGNPVWSHDGIVCTGEAHRQVAVAHGASTWNGV